MVAYRARMELSLRLTARQWATIDADMDNAAAQARDTFGDDAPARAIRQAGWDQVPWVGPTKEWPADTQVITIRLTREQWEFVLAFLRGSAPVYEELGDETSLRLGQDAANAVQEQLL
jgi:hypothetical protein